MTSDLLSPLLLFSLCSFRKRVRPFYTPQASASSGVLGVGLLAPWLHSAPSSCLSRSHSQVHALLKSTRLVLLLIGSRLDCSLFPAGDQQTRARYTVLRGRRKRSIPGEGFLFQFQIDACDIVLLNDSLPSPCTQGSRALPRYGHEGARATQRAQVNQQVRYSHDHLVSRFDSCCLLESMLTSGVSPHLNISLGPRRR
jgi:hypothetical protein